MSLPDSSVQINWLRRLAARSNTLPLISKKLLDASRRLENAKEDYDLCEQENVNLRKHLQWATERISPEHQDEMADRLEPSIETIIRSDTTATTQRVRTA